MLTKEFEWRGTETRRVGGKLAELKHYALLPFGYVAEITGRDYSRKKDEEELEFFWEVYCPYLDYKTIKSEHSGLIFRENGTAETLEEAKEECMLTWHELMTKAIDLTFV